MSIPVIDIFAGPGGLGEGFSVVSDEQGNPSFKIILSIEKERYAHRTLELRTFLREFGDNIPEEYYGYLRGEITREDLFSKYPNEAQIAASKTWQAELGSMSFPPEVVDQRIHNALNGAHNWVLVGGPPCQAYSIIGRSRMRGKNPIAFEKDPKHMLYKEYLRILAVHMPPVFIMENVKGILSTKLNGDSLFSQILLDLQDPTKYISESGSFNCETRMKMAYKLYSFSEPVLAFSNPSTFVIKMKYYGIPQDRQRVIIIGIREDLNAKPNLLKKKENFVTINQVIGDLPKLRSMLSRGKDSEKIWVENIKELAQSNWINDQNITPKLKDKIISFAECVCDCLPTGGRFVHHYRASKYIPEWFSDKRLRGVCNHYSRTHMKNDIDRYFFVSCFGQVYNRTPLLKDFPKDLLPEHDNAKNAMTNGNVLFSDRFRVQLQNKPATTITSHIAKDGHYFIHFDPQQCRSLTVREAARIQTFPDNYFFEGPQTSQYQQVGNAVPPLLAKAIAEIVYDLFIKCIKVDRITTSSYGGLLKMNMTKKRMN